MPKGMDADVSGLGSKSMRKVGTGNEAIREEWSRHQSSFARKWRAQMYARKKVDSTNVEYDESVLAKLKKAAGTEKQHQRMLKDWPLIEAARATEDCIASLDNDARTLFARAAVHVPALKTIVWVNPERPEEDPLGWLERGAKAERQRMLRASG